MEKKVKSNNNQNVDALLRLARPYENCREMDIITIHFINYYFQGVNKTLIKDELLNIVK